MAPGSLIEDASPRALFADLLAGALEQTAVRPTPQATAYLIGLLEGRLRAEAPEAPPDPAEETLALRLLRARGYESAAERAARLRAVGDHALFVAGFFRDRLERRSTDPRYVADLGRLAYADVSSLLAGRRVERTFARLFEELADRFPDFAEVLTEVGDQTRIGGAAGLEALTARFLLGESEADRRRLARRGRWVQRARGELQ